MQLSNHVHEANNSSLYTSLFYIILVEAVGGDQKVFEAQIEKGTNAYDRALAAATLPTSSELSTPYLKRTLALAGLRKPASSFLHSAGHSDIQKPNSINLNRVH